MSFDTPILLIVFNRPKLTSQVFEAIRKAKPQKLFISADGPRAAKPDDIEECKQTRTIVNKIDWDCELKIVFREENIGCKYGPISALDWFFNNVESGIILEDDCVPHETFFPYCEDLLKKYCEDERIMMISGTNFLFDRVKIEDSYFFSRYHLIWGWATWKRAWKLFDRKMSYIKEIQSDRYFKALFQTKREQNFWRNIYKVAAEDTMEEWDYKWAYSMHCNNGLCICPNTNLIKNIGFGSNATHTYNLPASYSVALKGIDLPLKHPSMILQDCWADEIILKKFFGVYTVWEKIKRKLQKLILLR